MDSLGRRRPALWAAWLTVLTAAGFSRAQTTPAASDPAPATAATSAATAAARKPTVDELLARQKPAPFDFTDAKITDIMAYIVKSYDVDIVDKYPLTDLLTMKDMGNLTAREAINILNASIMPLGYTVVESVRGDPARVVLTIVTTKADAGKLVPLFYGNDPAAIPEGDARRMQVLTFKAVDPEKARAMILSVVGAQADITINVSTKKMVITDTSTHVHTAAALLQALEKQAEQGQ